MDNHPHRQSLGIDQGVDLAAFHLFAGVVTHGLVLDKIRRRFPWLELIWADGGYNAWQVDAGVAKVPMLRMEIVKRSDDMKGFVT